MKFHTMEPHTRELPPWASKVLENPPAAGHGIHRWIFRSACALREHRSSTESHQLLRAAAAQCGRMVSDREIADAVRNSRACPQRRTAGSRGLRQMMAMGGKPAGDALTGCWPAPDWTVISAIAQTGAGMGDLAAASPVKPNGEHTADYFLDVLFPGQPLLCLARENPWDARTAPRGKWRNVHLFGLIVPSPMRALTGKRKDGKPSVRCLDNTGPRRFLVVEFDFTGRGGSASEDALILARLAAEVPSRTAPDLCAALLLHLIGMGAPLALAVHSGGKSIHGWFPVHGRAEADLRCFFACACRLGADPATWTACQLVRLPEGTRANGTPQKVLYFNPRMLPAA